MKEFTAEEMLSSLKSHLAGRTLGGKPISEKAIEDRFHWLQIHAPCIVCDKLDVKPTLIGLFIPHDAEKFGAEKNRERICLYKIHIECQKNTAIEKIEEKILETNQSFH